MDKQQLLSLIQGKLDEQVITREDLARLVSVSGSAPVTTSQSVTPRHEGNTGQNLMKNFYVIGALLAIVGVIILLAQYWSDIGLAGRILVTLGIGFATYVAGWVTNYRDQNGITQVMFLISMVLGVSGSFVLLDEMNIEVTLVTQMILAFIFFIIYGFTQYFVRKNILGVALVGFSSWFYFALVVNLVDNNVFNADIIKWTIMIAGFCYLCIGYALALVEKRKALMSGGKENDAVIKLLYGLGTIGVLGAGIVIGGAWDVIYILFIFAAIYGSVFLKSRIMLSLGSLFLVAYVIKLTAEYFLNVIGWPIALIFCGFVIIGVGYFSLKLHSRFIKQG